MFSGTLCICLGPTFARNKISPLLYDISQVWRLGDLYKYNIFHGRENNICACSPGHSVYVSDRLLPGTKYRLCYMISPRCGDWETSTNIIFFTVGKIIFVHVLRDTLYMSRTDFCQEQNIAFVI